MHMAAWAHSQGSQTFLDEDILAERMGEGGGGGPGAQLERT